MRVRVAPPAHAPAPPRRLVWRARAATTGAGRQLGSTGRRSRRAGARREDPGGRGARGRRERARLVRARRSAPPARRAPPPARLSSPSPGRTGWVQLTPLPRAAAAAGAE